MKLLFISPVGAFFSGAEVAISQLMLALQQRGHDIINVIPDNGAHKDEKYLRFMEEHQIDLRQLRTKKWWWKEAYNKIEDFEEDAIFAYYHKNISEIREIIKSEQVDLVISNTANLFQGAVAASQESVPHYYIIHEFPFGEFGYYKEKIAFMQETSEKIFAVYGDLYSELEKYIDSSKLLPFIPYSHLEELPLQESFQGRIVSIGGINERKNQLELIKAFEKMQPTDKTLVFIGGWDEAYKRKLDDYIALKGISGIEFLGHQPSPFRLVRDKDILVLTSKMEAFPLVFVEGILAGAPTLVSETYGHNTVRKFFGTKNSYPLGDEKKLADLMTEMFTHFDVEIEEAQTLKARARKQYRLSELSKVFYEEFERGGQSPSNWALPLKNLLGWDISSTKLEALADKVVTIYHSHHRPYYQIDKKLLKKADVISIDVGEADYIRLDLANQPGMYYDVTMVDIKTGKTLTPVHTTAIDIKERYIFVGDDSQIVYDTKALQHHCLEFSYKLLPFSIISEDYKDYQNQVDNLTEDKFCYMRESEEYKRLYNSVINSRRWTISTKIINFLRRKK